MSKKRNYCLLSGGCVLVAVWLLVSVLAHGDASRDAGPNIDRVGAVTEEKWRELPINQAVVHPLNGGDLVFPSVKNFSGYSDVARELGGINLPQDATVGEPSVEAGRANHLLLARWFTDTCQLQRIGCLQQVKLGSTFCIFSNLFEGEPYMSLYAGCAEVRSLRIRGNRLILKIAYVNGGFSTKDRICQALVEAPFRPTCLSGSIMSMWIGSVGSNLGKTRRRRMVLMLSCLRSFHNEFTDTSIR